MQNFFEEEKKREAEAVLFRQKQDEERRHHEKMAEQKRMANAAEGSVKIAKWSLGLAVPAFISSLSGWTGPVILEWFRIFGK